MMSEASLFKKKTPPRSVVSGGGRGALVRSPSARIRDIDRELVILENNYLKQMQQCTQLHSQIVNLMKEKNANLNEALL